MFLGKRPTEVFARRVPSLTTLAALVFLSACGGGAGVTSTDGSSGTSPTPAPSSYAVAVEVEGGGTITSTPGGINCSNSGGACRADYANGTNVTLVAAP